ncbi:MAG: ABC transporter ATP-binding protein [Anaerolineaceae bacterium]|nr:ABC transporter ATP-binding protein [Anaerolineaceae bacterium]
MEIKGLKKTYRLEDRSLDVLRGVNYFLPDGNISIVLGKSGCGKTTLLRLIAGLEQPDEGIIDIPSGQRIACVFQEPRLMPWLNIRDNIQFGLNHRDICPDETRQILHLLGLESFERAYPAELSGGMQQRVALGRALAYHPSLLLMDEPLASLDFFTRREMQNELLRILEKRQISVLFVTHSIDEALILADQITVLKNGTFSRIFSLPQPHPRNLNEPEMIILRQEILDTLEEENESSYKNVLEN